MNNQDKAVNIASIIKNLCDDKGTLIPLGKYMGTLTKDSPEWGPRLKQYNADKALLLDSLKADADDSTLRVRVTSSLVSPEKHRAIQANGFKSGSAMFHASEITRKQKSKAFWDGMNANALPVEMGLTDKEFWQLSRHNGFVSPEWKRSTSNGSLAFTAAAESAWVKDYKETIVAAREKETARIEAELKAEKEAEEIAAIIAEPSAPMTAEETASLEAALEKQVSETVNETAVNGTAVETAIKEAVNKRLSPLKSKKVA